MKKTIAGFALMVILANSASSNTVVDTDVTYVEALTNIVAAMSHQRQPFPAIKESDSLIAYGMAVGMAQQLDAAKLLCSPKNTTNAAVVQTIVKYAAANLDVVPKVSPAQLTSTALLTVYGCGVAL